jgi:hypothetical protein
MFPVSQKNNNILNMVMSFFTEGQEAIIESVLRTLGEFSLHLIVIVATSMAVTFFYESGGFPVSGGGVSLTASTAGVTEEL